MMPFHCIEFIPFVEIYSRGLHLKPENVTQPYENSLFIAV